MNYTVVLKDINGNVLGEIPGTEKEIKAGPVIISDGKFIKNDTVILEAVVTNALMDETPKEG